MGTFKWGIIGPGSIAKDFIDDLKYVKTPQTVQAVLGRREEQTKEFAEEFNIPQHFTDINIFIKESKPDAVYIATPHTLHFEETLICLQNKIPVLCEKPLAINSEQVEKMMEAAAANSTFLLEGMWIRFLPSITKLLELVESDAIGKIITVKASLTFKAPEDEDNRYFNPELGGGSLLDLGVYPVFLCLLLLGKPATIKAVARLSEEGVDETCAVLFGYDGGETAVIDSSFITETDAIAEVSGEKGVIKILSPWNEKPDGIQVILYTDDPEKEKDITEYPCEWEGRGFQFEVEEVISCLGNKQIESNLLCHHFSLDLMETMDEIRKQIHVKYEKYE